VTGSGAETTRTRLDARPALARLASLPCFRIEGEGAGVDAVALAGGAGAVAEDVAQVSTATATVDLGAGDYHLPVP
jgi:hypothetical protein